MGIFRLYVYWYPSFFTLAWSNGRTAVSKTARSGSSPDAKANFLFWLVMKMKKLLIVIINFILIAALTGCTASQERDIKSIKSNWNGGLKRTVTLYDHNGKAIRTWEGKIDMTDSEHESDFVVNGKRVIVHGGIVVAEEK